MHTHVVYSNIETEKRDKFFDQCTASPYPKHLRKK